MVKGFFYFKSKFLALIFTLLFDVYRSCFLLTRERTKILS
ncbi:hypothetical protein PORCRE_1663 [Porphyromonas crevioricanis JCM 15906]|uniref:Uncharacterized protein n=1 Tax=Porphyromonas crevioricanis JCM 15906 TaxID=1305617 RepID=T1DTQ7_9PORP|nr:hypothetical protein PORCRE_1663 [Porphyromonas crevioricanis JCM 15906]